MEKRESVKAWLENLDSERRAQELINELERKAPESELAPADSYEKTWTENPVAQKKEESRENAASAADFKLLIEGSEAEAREAAYKIIDNGLETISGSDKELRACLDVMGKMNPESFSVRNFILLASQQVARPVKAQEKWNEKGYHVLPDSRPVVVLEHAKIYSERTGKVTQSYYPKKLYQECDVRDEDGGKISEKVCDSEKEIEKLLAASPARVCIAPDEAMPDRVDARFCPEDNVIYIRNIRNIDRLYRSLAKEIVHAQAYADNNAEYRRSGVELEAGLVSYIMSVHAGFDTDAMGYDMTHIITYIDEMDLKKDERGHCIEDVLKRTKDAASKIANYKVKSKTQQVNVVSREENTMAHEKETEKGRLK